jgi:hypothetical protein
LGWGWWRLDVIDPQIYNAQKNSHVLFIFKESGQIPPNLPIQEVYRTHKPGGKVQYDIIVGTLKK